MKILLNDVTSVNGDLMLKQILGLIGSHILMHHDNPVELRRFNVKTNMRSNFNILHIYAYLRQFSFKHSSENVF